MKNIKNLVAFVAAAAALGSASAANVTYISGSTAFGGAAMPAITNFVANNNGTVIATDSGTVSGSKALVASYTNGSGQLCYISVRLTGSEAGIQSAASPAGTNLISFPKTNPATPGLGNLTTNDYTVSTNVTIAFSDTYQSASRFNGVVGAVTYAHLGAPASGELVGVTTFNWVASSNFPATVTNITTQFARALLLGGKAPLSLLTGTLSDSNNGCYLVGRNVDSGTRITTFAETGFGVLSATKQYALGTNYYTNTAGATILATIGTDTNKLFLWPVESINNVSSGSIGNGGYSSGGTLCQLMTNALAPGNTLKVIANSSSSNSVINGLTTSAFSGTNYLIGYAGRSDANGKTNGGLVLLNYNGVANTTNNVANGGYTFWSYEHMLLGVNTNADDVALANGISSAIGTLISSPNVPLSAMKVQRASDGAVVTGNY
jgi:hypothetical protein